ncbi:MAG: flagellar hook-length control protein FliK, partial [Candidatus Marinimicrobia bacterium]|nr:flagellar hook-length control protein FliK [Candidatus Neomarinimicrobiota bacterium]
LQQVELNDSISHEAITGTGFLPAMVVQKITQIIFQSHEKQISEMSFIIDGKQLGSLEIKFTQDSIGNQATIIVESETIRNLIEKVLPIINENLSQKGMALNSLEVQVGDFGKSKMQDEKHKRYSEKYRASNIKDEIEDKINQIIAIRDYGYNTIEVLA